MNRKVTVVIICVLVGIIAIASVRIIQINDKKYETDEKYEQLATNSDKTSTDFAGLVQTNGDFVGWLKVDSTKINYPVVQNKANSEYYLNHDFYKNEDSHGVPFIDSKCDYENCDNLIISHIYEQGNMAVSQVVNAYTLHPCGS